MLYYYYYIIIRIFTNMLTWFMCAILIWIVLSMAFVINIK